MRDLVLLLTDRCNLCCSYCWQEGRSSRQEMTWDVARTALELLLCSPRAPRLLVLSGGEPLLAGDLFRRCVELARARFPSPADLRIAASTNGTLFGDHLVRFLAANDVALQVSYDGAGQEQRAPGTAPAVAAALRRLGELEPEWFGRRVRVALTLTPATLPLLASSIASILGLGVRDVAVAAVTAAEWPPGPALESELDRQLERIVAAWRDLGPEAGASPVSLLREPASRSLPAEDAAWCRAAVPESVAVDPGGAVWGCPSAASSMQRLSPAVVPISEALFLGDVRDPDLPSRLAALPVRARSARALTHRRGKRSELAECGTCEHLLTCSPCALAAARVPGGADPDLVPTITCALSRASARARATLPRRPSPLSLLIRIESLTGALRKPGRQPVEADLLRQPAPNRGARE